ncbi:MAG: ammonia-forming cytochrome c nitrite reductase subunit c552 [bacterium]|nr:ammonia-forming cytochrome c nitrite reductase subunit c552 [bacterium]
MSDNDKPSQSNPDPAAGRAWRRLTILIVLLTLGVGALTFGLTALLVNIFTHKQEERNPFYRVVELTDETVDPAVWGKNFPQQYDGYKRTVDMVRTRFGGSEAYPHAPTATDPRTKVSHSRLDDDPRLRTMWAGYAFAVDFREERGHAYMLEDQSFTGRQQASPQPGACLHCHASTYVPYKKIGGGDLIKGFEKLNPLPYAEARAQMEMVMKGLGDTSLHPVACIDCHDPKTMQLRVTRPGFIEGIAASKKSAEEIDNYDPNTMATRQEMRSFVCGQCHVEYYFKGKEKRLTYPWTKGLRADQILSYYQENGHKDWTHALTGAPALKAQHPEFEMWNQGTHARSGVTCADCHMPYKRVGALKVSDHHVRSPLLNINNACQTCHKVPEKELLGRVVQIQSTTYELRGMAMDALIELIGQIKAAREAGAGDADLVKALDLQRQAQFLLDFIEAENSMGFHAPQETARVLFLSLDKTRQGQAALRGMGMIPPGMAAAVATGATDAAPPPAAESPEATGSGH